MTRLLLALILWFLAVCGASAASPVDDYIAARDAYLARFNASDIVDEAARTAHEGALGDLEARLRDIVGPSRIARGDFQALTKQAQAIIAMLAKK